MKPNYDFSGWATRNNLRCSDGRTIRDNAFAECDGKVVPLVWMHQHNDPKNVLGHALLENRKEGVYAYCSFNGTANANDAREFVSHGDVKSLSIYANQLKQVGGDVVHGVIREVSLVLAGANPEAFIDSVIAHGEYCEDDAVIYSGEEFSIEHADKSESMKDPAPAPAAEKEPEPKAEVKEEPKPEEKQEKGETVQDVWNTFTEKQKIAVQAMMAKAAEDVKNGNDSAEHADDEGEAMDDSAEKGETVRDVFNTLNEKQKKVALALIGFAIEQAKNEKNEEGDEEPEEDTEMKHNLFSDANTDQQKVLSNDVVNEIFADARQNGSLKSACLAHGIDSIVIDDEAGYLAHGIENVGYLFPEAHAVSDTPDFIERDMEWVTFVLNGVRKTPFSRIKTLHADITEAEARAKGYIKGNEKYDEVFPIIKRVTSPCTVYKHQSMDRDDVIDITDFDAVAWIKGEMKVMLNEEIARAILISDGRSISSKDKINEASIRPVWTDDDLYTIKKVVPVAATATDDEIAKATIKMARKARREYKGSGNKLVFIGSEDIIDDMLLMEDTQGHIIYDTEEKLCNVLRVSKVLTCPLFNGVTRQVNGATHALLGLILDLGDYRTGSDRKGEITMFDDFDIDYNKEKYLIETRMCGALAKPKSAIALEMVYELGLVVEPEDGSTTLLGKNVSDLQAGVVVNDNFITGTLKYVTEYTGFSGDPAEQSGNYLALKFADTPNAVTKVELTGGPRGPVTLDSDKQAVIRITDKASQKLKVTSTLNGQTLTRVYSLTSLKVQTA